MNKEKLLNKIDLNEFTKLTNQIAKTYNISEEEAEEYAIKLGPKKLKQLNTFEDPNGWRAGYTKKTMGKRKSENRKKNKLARKARKGNR